MIAVCGAGASRGCSSCTAHADHDPARSAPRPPGDVGDTAPPPSTLVHLRRHCSTPVDTAPPPSALLHLRRECSGGAVRWTDSPSRAICVPGSHQEGRRGIPSGWSCGVPIAARRPALGSDVPPTRRVGHPVADAAATGGVVPRRRRPLITCARAGRGVGVTHGRSHPPCGRPEARQRADCGDDVHSCTLERQAPGVGRCGPTLGWRTGRGRQPGRRPGIPHGWPGRHRTAPASAPAPPALTAEVR